MATADQSIQRRSFGQQTRGDSTLDFKSYSRATAMAERCMPPPHALPPWRCHARGLALARAHTHAGATVRTTVACSRLYLCMGVRSPPPRRHIRRDLVARHAAGAPTACGGARSLSSFEIRPPRTVPDIILPVSYIILGLDTGSKLNGPRPRLGPGEEAGATEEPPHRAPGARGPQSIRTTPLTKG